MHRGWPLARLNSAAGDAANLLYSDILIENNHPIGQRPPCIDSACANPSLPRVNGEDILSKYTRIRHRPSDRPPRLLSPLPQNSHVNVDSSGLFQTLKAGVRQPALQSYVSVRTCNASIPNYCLRETTKLLVYNTSIKLLNHYGRHFS